MPGWPGSSGNDTYLGKTLRYNEIELGFNESVSWRVLWYLWLRAFIVSGVIWSVFFFFAAIAGFSALSSSAGAAYTDGGDTYGQAPSSGLGTATTLLMVGGILSFLVFWLILLASKLPEPIAEWRVLMADRGDRADSVYSQISGTLRERQLPLGWRVRRIRTGLGPMNVSNRLVVADRSYTAYVSVFSYGTSLYLGWTMWRSRRGTALVARFVADLIEGLAGRRDMERQMMRTERPRAMREAVHAACREGLYTAAEGLDVPIGYGFPQGLPQIEEFEVAAPVPVGAGGHPGPQYAAGAGQMGFHQPGPPQPGPLPGP